MDPIKLLHRISELESSNVDMQVYAPTIRGYLLRLHFDGPPDPLSCAVHVDTPGRIFDGVARQRWGVYTRLGVF